jgi:hypothetical protein
MCEVKEMAGHDLMKIGRRKNYGVHVLHNGLYQITSNGVNRYTGITNLNCLCYMLNRRMSDTKINMDKRVFFVEEKEYDFDL